MATLRYQLDGQEHWVNLKDATTIGRADINDVCIPLISLSRQHAIISRIAAAGKLAEAAAIYASQSDAQKFAWDGYAWFWSDNAELTAYAAALEVPVEALLARDLSA
jgi:hypothetical protein